MQRGGGEKKPHLEQKLLGGDTKKLGKEMQKWLKRAWKDLQTSQVPQGSGSNIHTTPATGSSKGQDPSAPILREIPKGFPKFQTLCSACTQNSSVHLQKEVKHSEGKWHVQGHLQSQLQSQEKSNQILA